MFYLLQPIGLLRVFKDYYLVAEIIYPYWIENLEY